MPTHKRAYPIERKGVNTIKAIMSDQGVSTIWETASSSRLDSKALKAAYVHHKPFPSSINDKSQTHTGKALFFCI